VFADSQVKMASLILVAINVRAIPLVTECSLWMKEAFVKFLFLCHPACECVMEIIAICPPSLYTPNHTYAGVKVLQQITT
jgi:hypothetical protein